MVSVSLTPTTTPTLTLALVTRQIQVQTANAKPTFKLKVFTAYGHDCHISQVTTFRRTIGAPFGSNLPNCAEWDVWRCVRTAKKFPHTNALFQWAFDLAFTSEHLTFPSKAKRFSRVWHFDQRLCMQLSGFSCWFSFAPVFQWCCSTP